VELGMRFSNEVSISDLVVVISVVLALFRAFRPTAEFKKIDPDGPYVKRIKANLEARGFEVVWSDISKVERRTESTTVEVTEWDWNSLRLVKWQLVTYSNPPLVMLKKQRV
jgi:hypothetical protein